MKKTLISLLALALMCAAPASAIDNGTYYLYNVGTQQWLNFGGSDSYSATFFRYGAPITITADGSGTYTLTAPFYDSPNTLTAAAAKGTAAAYTIVEQADGTYTLSSTNGMLGYDGTTSLTGTYSSRTVSSTESTVSDNTKWKLYTKAQLTAALSDASEENPMDATFFISCPEFQRHATGCYDNSSSYPNANRAWINLSATNHGYSGYSRNYCGYAFNQTFDIYQDLTGLPAGKYKVKCQGFYRYGSNTVCTAYTAATQPVQAYLYAGEVSAPLTPILASTATASSQISSSSSFYKAFGSTFIPYYQNVSGTSRNDGAGCAFDNGLYADNELEVVVDDAGTLRIGVKDETGTTNSWTAFDNFELEYLGPNETPVEKQLYSGTTYYLYNLGAGLWMDFGGSDDYTACLKAHGAPMSLTDNGDGTWTINCPMSDKNYLSAAGVAGSTKGVFTITKQDDNTFTIATADGKYLGFSGTVSTTLSQTVVGTALTADGGDNIKWDFLTLSELEKRLASATQDNPVDATFYISEPNFNRHGSKLSSWANYNTGYCSGYLKNNCGWNVGAATVSQALKGLRSGRYTLRVQGVYSHGTTANVIANYTAETMPRKAYLFAGTSKSQLMGVLDEQNTTSLTSGVSNGGYYYPALTSSNTNSAVNAFDLGLYADNRVDFLVGDDGEMTIGVKLTDTETGGWMAYDNFTLEYLGEADASQFLSPTFTVGAYTPLCLPYDITSSDFGQTYAVATVVGTEVTLVPVASVAAGTPCVVKANAASATIPESELDARNYSLSGDATAIALWDNTLLEGSYASMSWDATLVDGTELVADDLSYSEITTDDINVTIRVENRAVQRFLEGASYTSSSTASVVSNYNVAPPARRDQPKTFVLPMSDGTEYEIENMIPGATYTFDQTDANGQHYVGKVTADGSERMIKATSANNIRDLGGWQTEDGRVVRYGRLYRGGALNGSYTTATAADIAKLKALGIGSEIDLRYQDGYDKDDQVGVSAFGFSEGTTYYCARANDYTAANLSETATQGRLKVEFEFILDNLRQNRSVYYHCAWGADRTGLLTFLLEGVLGMSQGDIYKDYELTSFSAAGNRLFTSFQDRVSVITALDGTTLRDKFENYFTNTLGITSDEIAEFRNLMLSDGKATMKVTAEAQYGTFMAPFEVEIPSGVTAYCANALNGALVTLNEVDATIPANTPVVLHATEAVEQTFTGRDISIRNASTKGLLTGVLSATVPGENFYVLQRQSEVTGFYQTAATTSVPRNRCYLTAPAGGVKAFFFSAEDATAIEALQALTSDDVKIYDVNGRRLPHLMRGVNIVGGKKVIVK